MTPHTEAALKRAIEARNDFESAVKRMDEMSQFADTYAQDTVAYLPDGRFILCTTYGGITTCR
jgi:hypothetical protein